MGCSWLAWPLTALLGLFSPHKPTTDYERMVSRVSDSIVRITMTSDTPMGTRQGVCSGFALAKQRVLTAAHCVDGHESIRVDGQTVVEIMRVDTYADLAWLNVSMLSRTALTLRHTPVERFEPLTAIGYGYGWSRLSVRPQVPFLIGFSIDDNKPKLAHAPGIVMQGGFAGGMSGGPIVDARGLVVSVVQLGADGVGIGVTGVGIRAFLEGLL